MSYLYLLLLIPIAFILRALNYQRRVSFLSTFEKQYRKYIEAYIEEEKTGKKNPAHEELTIKMQRKHEYAKKYILEAGLANPRISRAEPIGLGFADTRGISVLDNMAYLRDAQVVGVVKQCLQKAIGYYEHARNENFNPLFWIEYLVVKAPKSIIDHIIDAIKRIFKPS